MNKDMPQDLRTQTLALVNEFKPADARETVGALIGAWIGALDEDDLAGIDPRNLAAILWDAFAQVAQRTTDGCQIAQMRYTDGRCGMSTALLILNEDMPYLVDSFVMALRRQRVVASGVMNAVLPVRRDVDEVAGDQGRRQGVGAAVLAVGRDAAGPRRGDVLDLGPGEGQAGAGQRAHPR